MARVYSDEKKEEYLAEYHESGKSKSEFTREKDIPTTFQRWIDNENRSTYGMIDLNKLDKEKQQVMSNVLKPIVFASSKIKIELQEGYDKNLLRSVVEVLINDTKVIEWNNNNIYGTITCNRSNISKILHGNTTV